MKKNTNTFKKLAMLASLFLGIAVLATSCSDDDVDPGNSVNVKVVNASEGAGSQDVYLGGSKVTTVNENNASNYIVVAGSGDDRKLEFKKAGATEVYASDDFDLDNNKSYTFFLTGTGSSVGIKASEDDTSTPPSGQAKVRFIHLSSKAPQSVDVYTLPNTKIASNVKMNDLTNYINVNPGLGIGVLPAGSTSMSEIMALNDVTFQSGNSYTVVISGTTAVSAWAVRQNQ